MNEPNMADRFQVRFDNLADPDVFRYEFIDGGEVIESDFAYHPRIIEQRFEVFKLQRMEMVP